MKTTGKIRQMERVFSIMLALFVSACKCDSTNNAPQEEAHHQVSEDWTKAEDRVTCPVCGLSFPKHDAAATALYKENVYYFYLKDHHTAFNADPEKYLSQASSAN